MGIQDRDYYWEDRKRRENKYKKNSTNQSANELKKNDGATLGKPASARQGHGNVARKQWVFLLSFLAGGFITFWAVMVILNINGDLLYVPYNVAGEVLAVVGKLWR